MKGGRVPLGGEVADPAVAQLDEVRERGGGPGVDVEANRRPPGALGLDQHHPLLACELRRQAHLEQEVSVDGAGAESLERLLLPPASPGVDERHRVPRRLGGALGTA